ncbi:phosphatidylserine decarboxylase [Helicobacter suis]|uniref:phosphatidylserine decarboxylase n=1 Tax=Helicobacter suis TaxID=104628 RepID=UPI0001F7A571|nr:phosphatidylserine decarboxylase [Helicobacter suis]EFX43374.1 phosphatidylserine decarboxylase [Helicobacter suis HS1]
MATSNTLSRLFGKFARYPFPKSIQRLINQIYVSLFKINLDGFAPIESYPTLNALFTRALQTPRFIDPNREMLIAPCDALITVCAPVTYNLALQIKGMDYQVGELLGQKEVLTNYLYFNFYLSPKNYHRFHAPCDLQISEVRHFCGELLSVNPAALNQYRYRNAFIRNERVVVVATDVRGQLLYFVAIGALNVGQIVLNFDPSIHTNARVHKNPKIYTYNPPISISKGTELGRFEMGSSVVLFVQNSATFDSLQGQEISFATPIATFKQPDIS